MMKKGNSILGEFPPLEQETCPQMAYTVNIPPSHWVLEHRCKWEDLLPDKQRDYLRDIHVYLIRELDMYVERDNNKVVFEFTMKGEVHSHGYITFKDKYSGYEKYVVMVTKLVKQRVKINNIYCCYARWCTSLPSWEAYLNKDVETSGYEPYIYKGEQIMVKRTYITRWCTEV